MHRIVAPALALGLFLFGSNQLSAQAKPSFAGSWTRVVLSTTGTISLDTAATAAGSGTRTARGDAGTGGAATGGQAVGGGRAGGRMGRAGGGRMGGGMGRGGGMFAAGLGDAATIVQDAKTLTITRTTAAGEVKTVVNLDGTPSTNTVALGGRGGGRGGGRAGGDAGAGGAAGAGNTGTGSTGAGNTGSGNTGSGAAGMGGAGARGANAAGVGAGGARAGLESITTAKWDGSKLVVTTSIDVAANTFQTIMSLMLNDAGELVVESVTPGLQGGPPTATTMTYKKG